MKIAYLNDRKGKSQSHEASISELKEFDDMLHKFSLDGYGETPTEAMCNLIDTIFEFKHYINNLCDEILSGKIEICNGISINGEYQIDHYWSGESSTHQLMDIIPDIVKHAEKCNTDKHYLSTEDLTDIKKVDKFVKEFRNHVEGESNE